MLTFGEEWWPMNGRAGVITLLINLNAWLSQRQNFCRYKPSITHTYRQGQILWAIGLPVPDKITFTEDGEVAMVNSGGLELIHGVVEIHANGEIIRNPLLYSEEEEMSRIVDGSEVVPIARQELPLEAVRKIDSGTAINEVLASLDPALHTLARRYHSLRIHSSQELAGQRVCIG